MSHAAINRIIGKTIRQRRLRLGLSQTALAEQIGVTFQQVQKYERGDNAVSCARLLLLAVALRCTAEDIYREAWDSMSAPPEPLR